MNAGNPVLWDRHVVFFHHRITLSAGASTFGGIVRPICFAAFRLMISPNFCCSMDLLERIAGLPKKTFFLKVWNFKKSPQVVCFNRESTKINTTSYKNAHRL